MDQELWTAVDSYINAALGLEDPALAEALKANAAAGLPGIDVSPSQGKLLFLLVQMCGARRVLEIGTLGGYSTIWMARALPENGRLVSLEKVRRHAEVAAGNIKRAGLGDRVEVIVGPAVETLSRLEADGTEPFDFIFLDADKSGNPAYLRAVLPLSRPGTVIVVDNVISDGAVIDAQSGDADVIGSRAAFEALGGDKRLSATALQTVGSKGHDGFAIAIVS